MGEPLLIGIDLGTTACKAAVFSKDGSILALSYREYPLIRVSVRKIEQNAEEWWVLVKDAIKECTNMLSYENRMCIKALSISAQGISFVPIDAEGRPTANAISWLDSRAEEEALELVNTFGKDEIYWKTGIQANPVYILPKIIWLKKNRPDIYKKTHRFCTSLDFLMSRLTGKFVTDHSMAGGSLMHDVRKLEWSPELLKTADIDKEQLPELDWAGSVVGPVLKELVHELGIPEDTLIVLGGHDQECAGIGAGLQPGVMTISFGTASILLACTEKVLFDKYMRVPCIPSIEKNKWVMEAVVSVGGAGQKWIRDFMNGFAEHLFTGDKQIPEIDYDKVVSIAQKTEIGASGLFFYPHMTGATSPYWIPSATGVFHGISLSTSMAHMVRAVMEGWIFQIKTNFNVLKEFTYEPEKVILFGGGAKDPFIRQLTADVLNKPVLVTETTETALLGASILAGVGCGIYKDIPSAQSEVIRLKECICPIEENVQKASDIYRKYLNIEEIVLATAIPKKYG